MAWQLPNADEVVSTLDGWKRLIIGHPWYSLVVGIGVIVFLGLYALFIYKRWDVPGLRQTIAEQKQIIADKNQQIILLETQLGPFKTIALERYPGAVTEALARLAKDLEKLQKDLIDATTSIKALDATVSIKVTADWKDGKPPTLNDIITLGGDMMTLRVVFEAQDGDTLEAKFYGFGELGVISTDEEWITVQYQARAAPGSAVFGTKPTGLVAVQVIQFCPFGGLKISRVVSRDLKLEQLDIQFFVNGKEAFKCYFRDTKPGVMPSDECGPWLTLPGRRDVVHIK